LDDVKETEIQVKENQKQETRKPNLNVGEVDLGYVDHSKRQKKKS
jgi:hypothetical protein